MHKSSLLRMAWFRDNYKPGLKILDVGSMDINGSYKDIFFNYDYTGVDIASGPNVDVVLKNPYQLPFKADSFNAVISGQAFEHIEYFWLTMAEMVRVTKDLICVIAPHGFKEHRHPVDCWRFLTDGMIALARYYELEILHASTNKAPTMRDKNWFSMYSDDSILVARKDYSGNAKITKDLTCIPMDHSQYGMVKYKPNLIERIKAKCII